jgi:tetratricopeptide (TPR) repeat protein
LCKIIRDAPVAHLDVNRYSLFILFAVILWSACNSKPPESPALIARSDFWVHQGEEALRQNEFDFAIILADSAEKLAPENANVHFLRGRIYSEVGQWQNAETAYRKALALQPDYRGVWNNLGNNAYRQQKYYQAIAFYQKELETSPAAIPYRGVGRAYVELGKVDSAHHAFEQAIAADSLYSPAHFSLGFLFEDEGEFEKALQHARSAWQLDPENLEYRYLTGELLVKTRQYEEALSVLGGVVAKWPWHHGAQYNCGQALARLGRETEAKKYLDEAERVRAWDARLEHLENTVRSLPSDPFAHAALASMLRRTGRYNDAMHAYKVAQHLAPQDMEIRVNIANLHLVKGDTTRAIEHYRLILQHNPALVEARLNLGVVYALSGRLAEAEQAWREVLKYAPNHPAARVYLARLAKTTP